MENKNTVYIYMTLLIIVSFIVYVLNINFNLPAYDAFPNTVLPVEILTHFNLYIERFIPPDIITQYFDTKFKNNLISIYPIGAAITAIPFYIPYVVFHGALNITNLEIIGKISASIISAVNVGLIFLMMMILGTTRKFGVVMAVAFAFGSETFSISSQGLWQHGPATLWITIFLISALLLVKRTKQAVTISLLSGFSAGMVLWTRPEDVVILLPFMGIVFFERRLTRYLIISFIPLITMLILLMVYNNYYYGGPFTTGYKSLGNGINFSFPFFSGLLGNLISPSKGILVYMPWSVISFIWYIKIWKKHFYRSVYLIGLSSLTLYIVLYSKFSLWPAGWSFGPRYMTDISPVIILLIAGYWKETFNGFNSSKKLIFKIFFLTAISWSVFIQFLGTYVPTGGGWNSAAHPNHFVQTMWNIRGNQIFYYFNSLKALYNPPHRIVAPNVLFRKFEVFYKPYLDERGNTIHIYRVNTMYNGIAYIQNTGNEGWSAYPDELLNGVVHFSYHVWHNGSIVEFDGVRSGLLHSVNKGGGIKVYFDFLTPQSAGNYTYQFTLVQEGDEWFQTKYSSKNSYLLNINVVK